MDDSKLNEYYKNYNEIYDAVNELIFQLQNYNEIINNDLYQNKILENINKGEAFEEMSKELPKDDNIEVCNSNIKDIIKNLKEVLINRYNDEIQTINNKIDELKLLNNELSVVDVPEKFSKKIQFNTNVKGLDFNKLIEIRNRVNDSLKQSKEGLIIKHPFDLLKGSITNLEIEIKLLNEQKKNGKITKTDFNNKLSKIRILCEEKNFVINADNNYLKLTEEEKEDLNKMLGKIRVGMFVLENNSKIKSFEASNIYLDLIQKIDNLKTDLENYNNLFVNPRMGTFDSVNISTPVNKIAEFEEYLAQIRKKVNIHYEGFLNRYTNEKVVKLDKVRFENLMKKIDEVQDTINKFRNKFNAPEMFKENVDSKVNDSDIDKKIDEFDKKLTLFELNISKKDIEKVKELINSISEDIGILDRMVNVNKDKNYIDKVEKRKKRFNEILNENKNIINEEKNSKKTKKVKLADKLYEKYEKSCLLSAGYSFAALSNPAVGNMIIPAIMHGNDVSKEKKKDSKDFFDGINNILGSVINAKKIKERWHLVNNLENTANVAVSSVLKSIANHSSKTKPSIIKQLVLDVKDLKKKMENIEKKFDSIVTEFEKSNEYQFVDPNVGTRGGR